MRSIVLIALFSFTGACTEGEGERCNPLQYSDDGVQGDCADGLACVYPTAPACGVAYCCTIDATGKVTDRAASCAPDPTLSCAPDGSVAPDTDMTSAD